MLCNLKKPAKSIIRSHVTRMETLNKYLGLLPTIKNSPQAVASTELGNVPFNETTLASMVLSHLPVAWRTQYALTHKLVPESPRAILGDLENIEKLFTEKANKAARANKAKVAQNGPQAVQYAKKSLRDCSELLHFTKAWDHSLDLYSTCFRSEERMEGIRAYGEKRPPKYQL